MLGGVSSLSTRQPAIQHESPAKPTHLLITSAKNGFVGVMGAWPRFLVSTEREWPDQLELLLTS